MNLSNFSQIRHNGKDISMAKLNGEVLWESYDKDFYVEYELQPNDFPINYTYHSIYKANLPTLLLNVMDPSSEVKYSKIEITLNDGTITEDTSVTARDVKSIKLWYPKEVAHLMFIGTTEQSPNYIERLNFINVSNLKSYRLMFANSRCFIAASFSNHFANSSHITDMSRMFYNCRNLGVGELVDSIAFLSLDLMDVSNVENMSEMFYNCSWMSYINLSNWNTRNVTESHDMFYGVKSDINFNYNGSNYKNWTLTEEQTGFSGTFPWNAYENPYYIEYTIQGSSSTLESNPERYLTQISTDNETYTMDYDKLEIILNDETITSDLNTTTNNINLIRIYYNENVTSLKMPKNITSLNYINISKFTSFKRMFSGCSKLESLDLSSWDTSKVTDMSTMFYICRSLTSLDLSNFDTSNVTDMSSMFGECSSLTSLDLSNFDTSKVTDMDSMFSICRSLTSLDLSNFDTSNVTRMSVMFFNCSSLTSLNLSSFDTSKLINRPSFKNVSSDVDWCYDPEDPNSYANWTLTEEETGFNGTFPWNQ